MNRSLSFVFMLVFCLPITGEQAGKAPSRAERLAHIQKEQMTAEIAFHKAYAAIPDTPEGQKKGDALYAAYVKGATERFSLAVELAKADAKSDVAFTALEWILTEPSWYSLPTTKLAMELATVHHAANPKIGKATSLLGYYRPRHGEDEIAAITFLKAVAQKNPDRSARGQAYLGLALEALGRFAVAEYKKTADVEPLATETEKKFEAVLKDYGDCPWLRRDEAGSLGDFAKAELFELRHLRIGKVAPDIQGEDLDGVKFKLSDYRGKVVIVNFWGDW